MSATEWCPECRARKEVIDQFGDDTGDSRVVVEVYSVTVLECGHHFEVQTGTYRSPLQQESALPRAATIGDPFLGEDYE